MQNENQGQIAIIAGIFTLLGVALGAVLTGVINSRNLSVSFKHEEQKHIRDKRELIYAKLLQLSIAFTAAMDASTFERTLDEFFDLQADVLMYGGSHVLAIYGEYRNLIGKIGTRIGQSQSVPSSKEIQNLFESVNKIRDAIHADLNINLEKKDKHKIKFKNCINSLKTKFRIKKTNLS